MLGLFSRGTIWKCGRVVGGINLEDIAAPECFEIDERLKAAMKIPVFHDDQHGTAIVSAPALVNALEVANKNAFFEAGVGCRVMGRRPSFEDLGSLGGSESGSNVPPGRGL
jgi:hypothetical protein